MNQNSNTVSCSIRNTLWDIRNSFTNGGKGELYFLWKFYGTDLFGKINMKVKNYSLPMKKISADLDC